MKTRKAISKDQYFTSKEAADSIVEWLTTTGWFDNVLTIIEPCAGSKQLVDAVRLRHPNINIIMYDLYPLSSDVIEQDSLKLKQTWDVNTTKIFSNPPFGYSNSLAKKFVRTFKKYDSCWILTRGNLLGELAFLDGYQITSTLEINTEFYNYETQKNHNVDCLAFQFKRQINTELELFYEALDWFDVNIGHIVSKKYDKMLEGYRSRV